MATGIIGIDAPADIRDLHHNFTNWEWSWSHAGETALNAAGLLPIVGGLKYGDEVSALVKGGGKAAEVGKGTIDGVVKEIQKFKKPNQVHHYATNKSKTYTKPIENITKKYGLDLDGSWNKDLLLHQGRHPNVYHDYVLNQIKQYDSIARGNKDVFLELFENLKNEVKANPDMLYKKYWLNK